MNLIELPPEVLEKVFLKVNKSGGSIKTLTEVCKGFNELICSSNKLMNKLEFIWDETNCEDTDGFLESQRSYRKICIRSNFNQNMTWFHPKLLQFLKKQTSTISEIELYAIQRYSSELIKLFEIVHANLCKICLGEVNIIMDAQFRPMAFPKLKIIDLFMSENVDTMLNLFWNVRDIKNFIFFDTLEDHRSVIFLAPFLKSRKSIEQLEISDCEISVPAMRETLKNIANSLEVIKLQGVNFYNDEKAFPLHLPKLKCINMIYHFLGNDVFPELLFKLFLLGKNTEDFTFIIDPELTDDRNLFETFRGMLKNFSKLKTLVICNYMPALFVDNYLCKETTFHLHELALDLMALDPDYQRRTTYHPHIVSFIQKQQHLKEMRLSGIFLTGDIIESVLRLPELQKLIISSCLFDAVPNQITNNESVKELWLSFFSDDAAKGIHFIFSSCRNTRNLSMTAINVTKEISDAIATKMTKLEAIVFNSFTIFPMNFPSVTSIEFGTTCFGNLCLNDIIEVVESNRQLKALKMPEKVKYHPRYQFVIGRLMLEKLELHKHPFQSITKKPSTLELYLDYVMFVPAIILFLYFFGLFVMFTSSG